jgi:hypothetical protein
MGLKGQRKACCRTPATSSWAARTGHVHHFEQHQVSAPDQGAAGRWRLQLACPETGQTQREATEQTGISKSRIGQAALVLKHKGLCYAQGVTAGVLRA